ncbi:MAG TPA: response regulator [Chloroflexia bacterium]|jgi:DNA-binding response OmpR family regulator|nr:response regulator [Chloroflexia bacterium]
MTEAPPAPILVVEDDADIRETIAAILEMEGYDVELASNGEEAVSAIDHRQPSLVLLDMRMPVLDGWGFAKVMRERGVQVPIIVMTAAQDAGRWAREIGAQGYIAKPFDLGDLLSQVARYAGAM